MTASLFMRQLLPAAALSIAEQLYKGRIGTDPYIDALSFIKIPVWKNMNHRCFPVIGPCRLPDIISILRESGRVHLSEVGILRMIRCRLPDVIKPGPQELSHGKIHIPVFADTSLHGLCPPAGRAVPKARTLFVILSQNTCP